MKEQPHAKILFRYHSNIYEREIVETMWALTVDEARGVYKLDSIPFYGPHVAPNDKILAEFDEAEGMLTYRGVLEYSGNSVIQVIVSEESDIEEIRNDLKTLGCESEKANDNYFSMEVPKATDYNNIKEHLEELESKGILNYAEPCLSDKHRLDLS